MKARCYCKSATSYMNYHMFGITVCNEWRNNFQAFYDWAMDNGYADNLSIDRINNDGNYEPNNCRWSTRKEQANNRCNNKSITINNKTQTLKQWAEEQDLNYDTVYRRIYVYGWSPEKAIYLR